LRWVEQFDVDFVGKFPWAKVYSGSATTDDGPGDFTWPEKIFLLVRVDPYLSPDQVMLKKLRRDSHSRRVHGVQGATGILQFLQFCLKVKEVKD